MIQFVIDGDPFGKQRPLAGKAFKTGVTVLRTPKETRAYEKHVSIVSKLAMRGKPPMNGAVRISLLMYFTPSASWSERKKAAALANEFRPTFAPDASNVLKAIEDGMNGVVYDDDAQIVSGAFEKLFATRAHCAVKVEQIALPYQPRRKA